MKNIITAVSDYIHGTKVMQGAWPEELPHQYIDKHGNRLDLSDKPQGDSNFVHTKLTRSEMSESDGRMYDALGYVAAGMSAAILAALVALVVA